MQAYHTFKVLLVLFLVSGASLVLHSEEVELKPLTEPIVLLKDTLPIDLSNLRQRADITQVPIAGTPSLAVPTDKSEGVS